MWKTYDTGIDWLRVTAQKDGPDGDELEFFGYQQLERAHREGHRLEAREWFKYSGLQAGKVFIGSRHDGYLFQVSSAPAHDAALQLMEVAAGKTGRIDLQITGKLMDGDPDKWLMNLRNELEAPDIEGELTDSQSIGWRRSKKGGATLELGSRLSDRWGRIYNKTAEQRGLVEEGLIRFEVVFGRSQAKQVFETLRGAHSKSQVCTDLVRAFMGNRGIELNWAGGGNINRLPSSYVKTTKERQLRWIERNVAPTIRKLVDEGEGAKIAGFLGKEGLIPIEQEQA